MKKNKSLQIQTLMLCTSALFLVVVVLSQFAYSDELVEKGKAVYNGAGACASCHGPTGLGDGAAAVALDPKPRSFAGGEFKFDTDGDGTPGTDQDLENVITYGAQKYGGSLMMVGRPDLAESDRKALVAFVKSLKQ
jgi:mono/diheme cytochrome c family protein